ncbi:MAG: winged helix-turn-helix transcriptional regulator [Gemmatimonadota bacterium]|nr:winged helix-turn-helix transcriptional regulator [Gemmatimonadota bacterium]
MFGQFDLLQPGRLIRELLMMREIERDPSISQSRLALKMGLVPSMVNTYIRRMAEQGLVLKQGDTRRRTSYHLTGTGRLYRARLLKRYNIETVRLFKYAKQEIRHLMKEKLNSRNSLKVALYGAAETGELVCQVCLEMGHEVVGVVDSNPGRQGGHLLGVKVTGPESLISMEPDAVLITSMGHTDEIAEKLEPLRRRGVKVYSID